VDDRHVVRENDLLISWSATLGAYIWDGPEAVLNQHIFKVVSRIDRRFHYHLVRNAIADLGTRAHGSGIVHVTKGVFHNTEIALPPLSEQARIVECLDEVEARRAVSVRHLCTASAFI
jgi:type I restriction enzyme S subunit